MRLRRQVATLDPPRQANLLVGRQQRHLPDLPQVEAQRVERRLHAQIEPRRRLRLVLGQRRLLLRQALVPLAFDQLDRTVEQVGVEVVALLLRQLDVLERRGDLVIAQKPLLHACRDEPLQFPGVGTTVSRPKPSAEKPCVLYAFDLPLRGGEPGVRRLQHRQRDYSFVLAVTACPLLPRPPVWPRQGRPT